MYVPSDHKICRMTVKYTKMFFRTPSQIYQNWDFWYENTPSGNPGFKCQIIQFITTTFATKSVHPTNAYEGKNPHCSRSNSGLPDGIF
jgi:hypothetical protein